MRFNMANMTTAKYMSSKNVVQLTGVTYRQLDYWVMRSEKLAPQCKQIGTGHRRKFSFEDVVVIAVLAQVYKTMSQIGAVDATGMQASLVDAIVDLIYPYAEVVAAGFNPPAWLVWDLSEDNTRMMVVFDISRDLFTPASDQMIVSLKPASDKALTWFGEDLKA